MSWEFKDARQSPHPRKKRVGFLLESTNMLVGAKAVNSLGFVGQEVRFPTLPTIGPATKGSKRFLATRPYQKKKKGTELNLPPGP